MSGPVYRCEVCRTQVVQRTGRRPRYCSGRCRVAAHRARVREQRAADGVPAELRALRRWTRWERQRRGARITKVPLTIEGRPASSTDPSTWSSWRLAQRSSVGDGVGYVLAPGDGVVGIDLDECVDEHGQVSAPARALLDALPRTWVELSPSGRGLHVWGWGRVGEDGRGRRFVTSEGLHVEVYDRGRFLTVSGRPLVVAPLADVGQPLALFELETRQLPGGLVTLS